MDKLRSMQVFSEVVRLGSFSAAADSLDLVTSAVSRQVSELEQWLGTRLLYRTTRSLSLTEEGRQYLHRFESLLADVADLEQQATEQRDEVVGTLRVTTFPFMAEYLIQPVLPDFLAQNPKVKVSLVLGNQLMSLVDEGLDLAIRVGVLPDSNLNARQIGTVKMRTVASQDYLKNHGYPQKPDDLKDHNCLYDAVLDRHNQRWSYLQDGKEVSAPVAGNLVVNGGELITEMAVQGVGIAYLPNFFVDQAILEKKLLPVLENYDHVTFPLTLLYPQNRQESRALRLFIDLLVERYQRITALNNGR
jgi:LysR family transcriptional regulator for bpeEF and oprC